MKKDIFDYKLGLNEPINKKYRRHLISVNEPIGKRITTHHTERFHRKKDDIKKIIMGTIGKDEIIYGEHALFTRFPRHLRRDTKDIDVYSKNPRQDAIQTEKALDKQFKGDFFYVKKAEHLGTHKVIAHANEEGVADFSEMPSKAPYDVIRGRKYLKLEIEKQHRERALKDVSYDFRHPKDRDALNRIRIYEKMRKEKILKKR
jgi:hypothetical protein